MLSRSLFFVLTLMLILFGHATTDVAMGVDAFTTTAGLHRSVECSWPTAFSHVPAASLWREIGDLHLVGALTALLLSFFQSVGRADMAGPYWLRWFRIMSRSVFSSVPAMCCIVVSIDVVFDKLTCPWSLAVVDSCLRAGLNHGNPSGNAFVYPCMCTAIRTNY
jgi:hypothetical protein